MKTEGKRGACAKMPVPAGTGLSGLRFYPGYLGRAEQEALVAALHRVLDRAPYYTACMPKSGRPM